MCLLCQNDGLSSDTSTRGRNLTVQSQQQRRGTGTEGAPKLTSHKPNLRFSERSVSRE